MGGYGSGRHVTRHLTTDDLPKLDVRHIARLGDNEGSIRWSKASATLLCADWERSSTELRLYIRSASQSRLGPTTVEFTRTLCHFGGERTWFVCPVCEGRCAIVYLWPTQDVACRSCWQLSYSTQYMDEHARALKRYSKAKALQEKGQQRPIWSSTRLKLKIAVVDAEMKANRKFVAMCLQSFPHLQKDFVSQSVSECS